MKNNTKTPLVSIIIPAYNAAQYVVEAVESALAQTYKNCEVVVVDDGSTDNTRSILAPYVESGRIKYVYQPNAGLSAARNMGIKSSKGEYVALLDADDVFLPEKIERQVAYLESHPECDICYCDLYHFWDSEPKKLLKLNYDYYSGNDVLPNIIKRNFVAPLTMVVRRSVFDRFGLYDEKFRRSEDLEFLVRILARGARICFLDEILAKLRLRREGNLQSFKSQPEVKRTILAVTEGLSARLGEEEGKRLNLKKCIAVARLKTAFAYLENDDKKSAQPYVVDAFKDFFALKILSWILWLGIAVLPARFLGSIFRWYHLKSQDSFLKPARNN